MADLRQYDLAIIGGGIAGASLGKSMAEAGARVLILEGREPVYGSGARRRVAALGGGGD